MRRLALLTVVIATAVTLAAPVPPPSEKELIAKHWGKVYAPSDKYEFKLVGKALTVRTAGEPARTAVRDAASTIPTASRNFAGDFDVTVKIAATAPNPKEKFEDGMPATKAGLFIVTEFGSTELSLFQYHVVNDGIPNDRLQRVVWSSAKHGSGFHVDSVEAGKPLYLRAARKDKAFSFSYSFDGQEWLGRKALGGSQVWGEVSVGIFVSHTTHQIVEATFTDSIVAKPNEDVAPKK